MLASNIHSISYEILSRLQHIECSATVSYLDLLIKIPNNSDNIL